MSFAISSGVDPRLAVQQGETARANSAAGLAGRFDDPRAAARAAEEFEAVFLGQMLKPMFEGIEANPIFGGGQGEEMFQSLMIEEYGKAIAASGGIGIADSVKAAMLKLQETA